MHYNVTQRRVRVTIVAVETISIISCASNILMEKGQTGYCRPARGRHAEK